MNGLVQESFRPYLVGRQCVLIEQPQALIHLIDGHLVLVENKHGVTITGAMIRQTCNLLEQELSGDYSFVIDRKQDYAMALVEAYDELNARVRLKKVAVVAYRKLTETIAGIERKLCHKEFSVFSDVEAALAWAACRDGR